MREGGGLTIRRPRTAWRSEEESHGLGGRCFGFGFGACEGAFGGEGHAYGFGGVGGDGLDEFIEGAHGGLLQGGHGAAFVEDDEVVDGFCHNVRVNGE